MRDQLHGDGQSDGCPVVVPPDEGTTDQGHLTAAQESQRAGSAHPDNVPSGKFLIEQSKLGRNDN